MTKNNKKQSNKNRFKSYKIGILLFFVLSCGLAKAQLGFSFLNLPNNAKINGLGGMNVSLTDNDINLIGANPALLDSTDQRQIGVSYSPYFASSHLLNLNYSPNGRWAVQLQNLNYGNFTGTDAVGNLTEGFSANDFFVGITHARKIQNISFGITTKLVGSFLESYNSSAITFDLGGTFQHPKKDLTFGLVAKNIGFVITNYSSQKTSLPFDLQAGISFKPQFMPVRFSVTAHHLYEFDIAYNNQNVNFEYDENGNKIPKKIPFTDKLFRHFTIGTQLLIHKNFNILLGYNHLRRKELQIVEIGGGAGFCYGFSFIHNRFGFTFSNARYTRSGMSVFGLKYRFIK